MFQINQWLREFREFSLFPKELYKKKTFRVVRLMLPHAVVQSKRIKSSLNNNVFFVVTTNCNEIIPKKKKSEFNN